MERNDNDVEQPQPEQPEQPQPEQPTLPDDTESGEGEERSEE